MFRAIILPTFMNTRLCVTACGIMHPRCCRPATGWQHRGCIIPQAVIHKFNNPCNTQSSVPDDGQNNCPKHVELTEIINKQLLLYLVCCLYYLYFIIFFWDLLNNLNLFLYRMSYISYRYLFWFVKYSHFT
jgi:hypothetical protein